MSLIGNGYNTNMAKIDDAQCCFLTGTANPDLCKEIFSRLNLPESKALQVKQFADGEIYVKILETVRGKDVFVIQPTSPPVNDSLMELLLIISTARRASAKRITAIIPYYGYARQDRKVDSRTPISAADVARMIESMGVDRVVAVDLHCGQIQGFFPPQVPMDNLESHMVALDYFMDNVEFGPKVAVISPDAGGVYRARKFQESLLAREIKSTVDLAMLIKHRTRPNEIASMDLVGTVEGRDAIIIDDIIDTAGTLCEAAKQLKMAGATRVFAFITHGLFSGPAVERISNSELEQVVVTDTIVPKNREAVAQCKKIVRVSVGDLLAKAIFAIQAKSSISALWRVDSHAMEAEDAAVKPPCPRLSSKRLTRTYTSLLEENYAGAPPKAVDMSEG